MKKQLLINEISLAVATLFLITSSIAKNIWLVILGFIMIIYSNNRIKKLKGE